MAGAVRQGLAGTAGQGGARWGAVRPGRAWQGMAGVAGMVRQGTAWPGADWPGGAWQAR